jgi:serine phosphatase RsbU (regulator of sigma subunit)
VSKFQSFKKVYDFYTSDLSYKDIERLIKREVPEVYDFYVNRMKKPDSTKNPLMRGLLFIRNLFVEFLLQLSPIRRLLYTAAILMFVIGYFENDWQGAVIGFILLNLLLAFELADKLTAKDELAIAREIQTALMPKSPPQNPHFQISCCAEPALEVGGDYFNFINNSENEQNTMLVIGDISGKGMAAAIYMIQVHTIIKNFSNGYHSPKTLLLSLNKNLIKIFNPGTFFTLCAASFPKDRSENSDKNIKLARAGHMPVIHYRKNEKKCEELRPAGIGLGLINSDVFDQTLEEVDVKIESGDVLVFFTDGVIEAMNRYNEEFGEERLKNIIAAHADKPAKEIQELIMQSITGFTDFAPRTDDITLIVLKAAQN